MWSDQEKRIQKIDRLARSLLIQGILNDIYSLINSNKTAKDLWDALARHMLGSEYDEQDRKAVVLYEYETFKATEGELLLDTYIRYLQVINDLKKCGEVLTTLHTRSSIKDYLSISFNDIAYKIKHQGLLVCHYAGRFTDALNKKYVKGEIAFVDMIDNADFKFDLLNTVLSCIGYENDDEVLLYYKIPLKSLDIGLKPLVGESDFSNFLGYVNKHKIMYVYVELVETTEGNSDEDGEGDKDDWEVLDIDSLKLIMEYLVKISKKAHILRWKLRSGSSKIVQICLWIIDSGCSKHMTGNRALLMNFVEKFLGTVYFGNNDFAVIAGYGDVVIGSMTIKKVYYVEGLGHNLFSVGQFCDKGLEVAF
nr:integrase, catalytic region, zinc finger, CCHC-type, peptidase aspartic, catalytic [Tanacetum cinerariifolium]